MKREQKIVAIGAASGVIVTILFVFALTYIVPQAQVLDSYAERMRYALIANIFAMIPFLIMLTVVSNARFLGTLINPLRHAESAISKIDRTVTDDTFQQNFIFAIVSLTASTFVWHEYLNVIWACGIVFALARLAYWIGYRINPLYRTAGMWASVSMNLLLTLFVLYCTFW